jgi:shikimate kinase
MNIYLVGFMGCGKSTVGKKLANKLGFDFIDLDSFVEEQAGSTIEKLFKVSGEDVFRKFERNCLRVISQKTNQVISTGGGTPCFFDNMEVINSTGMSVYLKMSAETLFSRLKQSNQQRPLLKDMNDEELKAFIIRKLEERESFYSKAQFKVKAKDLNVEELADFLKKESYL